MAQVATELAESSVAPEDMSADDIAIASALAAHNTAGYSAPFDQTQDEPSLRGVSLVVYEAVKRLCDFTFAGLLLVLVLPLWCTVALLVRLTSPGPVLFRQVRSGKDGKPFVCYKFRTMVADAEKRREQLLAKNEMSGPVFKVKRDPRITWVGAVLRRTSADELPQLLNVLRGEMSLVGPRPPLPSEVALYNKRQRQRLLVKPGLTCLWQISGRNLIDFDNWMELDLEYVRNRSLRLDIEILLKTVPAVVSGRGAV